MPGSTFTTDVLRLASLILLFLLPGKLFPCSLLETSLRKFALGRLVGCFSQWQGNFQVEFYTERETKANSLNSRQRRASPYHDSFRHLQLWKETKEEVNGMLLSSLINTNYGSSSSLKRPILLPSRHACSLTPMWALWAGDMPELSVLFTDPVTEKQKNRSSHQLRSSSRCQPRALCESSSSSSARAAHTTSPVWKRYLWQ